jgi:acetyl esterase/lipase
LDVNAGSDAKPAQGKSLADRVAARVVYRVPGTDDVRVVANLKYNGVGDARLLMDVYVPPEPPSDERRPVVILVHGATAAAEKPKEWGFFQSWGRLIAASGMVAVAFNHRFSQPPESLLAEAESDVRSAIDYVRANADSWHADRDRICVSVWSSGGVFVAGLLRDRPAYVRCLVAFYAMLDLQQYSVVVDEAARELGKRFSAINYLRGAPASSRPMFIARAGRDEIPLLNDGLDRFVATALAEKLPVIVENHPSGGHGFDTQNDDERSREIIRGAIEFMRDHLRAE